MNIFEEVNPIIDLINLTSTVIEYLPGHDLGVKQFALYAALFLLELLVFGDVSDCEAPDPMSMPFSTQISSSEKISQLSKKFESDLTSNLPDLYSTAVCCCWPCVC